jgi:hypothetical protein
VRWAGHVASTEKKNTHRNSMVKPGGKWLLSIHRRRWEGDIKIDSKETRRENVEWTHTAQDRIKRCAVVSTVMNLPFSPK